MHYVTGRSVAGVSIIDEMAVGIHGSEHNHALSETRTLHRVAVSPSQNTEPGVLSGFGNPLPGGGHG